MSDKSAQKRLFDAIDYLEKSINEAIKEKDEALNRIEELLGINNALKEEIQKLKNANSIMSQELQERSRKNTMHVAAHEALLDRNSSYDVDLSITQLKKMLLRKS
ncbi:MAG: hypothetical protein AB8V23_04035 [Candidatus Midichloria sp.]|uniref:Uncharacterized protein n=1 Tax=Hyalomma marginatum TaxID=34627 RepID=A0A8S4C0Q0_9ACAR|nr:hypothetical protein MHYMCMPASI_00034 [Hyalomma marginatum]CAG7590385.1 hypothetical protein MHYMCMPSP_00275 [Hyalomma marginatum]